MKYSIKSNKIKSFEFLKKINDVHFKIINSELHLVYFLGCIKTGVDYLYYFSFRN
jgi:hypothetical protein